MEGTQGLSSRRAEDLLAEYGENRLKPPKKTGALKIFAGQFRDALVMILLASTVISLVMGDITEALAIIAIVFLNAVLGFVQEYKTERTLEKLGELSAPNATALRDGRPTVIPACKLVPGDVVLLHPGDKIPADGFLLEADGLCCDESMLTGESVGVEKSPSPSRSAPAQGSLVYMGTLVTKGKGKAEITRTGEATEMGKIAGMLSSIPDEQTPLQKRLDQMGKVIGIGCLAICAVVAATGILRGEDPFSMLIIGVSLSVAAVPEGLPAIVTIALALAVGRMVKRNALVRRLHAVETLGCANVICSDKTGTLTENRMTVTRLQTLERRVEVAGEGTVGAFTSGGRALDPAGNKCISLMLTVAGLCNNASMAPGPVGSMLPEMVGEPTEKALLLAAYKAGLRRESLGWETEAEIPFDSTRKMMSVLVRRPDGSRLLLCKGAPDLLLDRCTACLTESGTVPLTAELRQRLTTLNGEMAGDALRVLGFASRETQAGDKTEGGFTFLGMAGLLDPPRREAFDAVAQCRRARIRPVMITGDHAATAKAIAAQLGIFRAGDRIVTGAELDDLSDGDLARSLPDISVFARVTPAHKLRIVRAFKGRGSIVAMTGDGVNDAPAIKEADIGVAMGRTGTDVTKEAASVVLLDDNFATLVAAVEEGRVIYQNIRKFIRYLLSCNIGEVFTMFFAMIIGMPVPLMPIQILLVNLATDGLPAIALGLEPAEEDVMSLPPRRAGDSVFSGGLATTIVIRGLLIGLTTLGVFTTLLGQTGDLATARTGALLTLVTTQLIHVFECKSERRGLFSIHPLDNLALVGAVLISAAVIYFAIYNPLLATIFSTVPLTGSQLMLSLCYCAAVPLVSGLLLALRRPGRHLREPRTGTPLSETH